MCAVSGLSVDLSRSLKVDGDIRIRNFRSSRRFTTFCTGNLLLTTTHLNMQHILKSEETHSKLGQHYPEQTCAYGTAHHMEIRNDSDNRKHKLLFVSGVLLEYQIAGVAKCFLMRLKQKGHQLFDGHIESQKETSVGYTQIISMFPRSSDSKNLESWTTKNG